MGKKSSKSTTDPSKFAKPYITTAANTLQSTAKANEGNLQNISDAFSSGFQGIAQQAFTPDPLVEQARAHSGDVLGGKFLDAGNPYMEQMIARTGANVGDRVNSTFGAAGRTGSDTHGYDLSRGLADSELGLRYQNYGDERSAMERAAAGAGDLSAARFAGVPAALGLGQAAAETPYIGADFLSRGTAGLMGNYTTTKQSQSLGSSLAGLAGAGLAGWASGGFKGI